MSYYIREYLYGQYHMHKINANVGGEVTNSTFIPFQKYTKLLFQSREQFVWRLYK